jgi:hypothetical protein
LGVEQNQDGTVTSWFESVQAGTKHFRVSMPGKITKTGYFTGAAYATTVTFASDEDPSALGTTSTGNVNNDDANTLINIPGYHNVFESCQCWRQLQAAIIQSGLADS